MKLPNADRALIAVEKLCDYLLNTEHRRGSAKARLLISLGYRREQWDRLEADLRRQHLPKDVATVSRNDYGTCYEIVGALLTPSGRSHGFRTIWQIDDGTECPRLITMIPE